ncbi:hypothetical protein CC80DRAFT_500152 [Byssothecium circinans]|uniref:Uncharacterized protein n=1 Tax=Byssothecium circinans TaxID=147558 RepID=A0A6A5UAM4_9PLEO|nr:hypothetical protein CC80DRAFT_500152 [Byssothecium circinans]
MDANLQPGKIALHRMPRSAYSRAVARVKPMMAAFAAQYAVQRMRPTTPPMLDTLINVPRNPEPLGVWSLTRMVEYSIKERAVRGQPDHDVLLEVGPHPAPQRPIRDTVQHISGARQFDYNPTLARDSDPILSLANSIGRLRCWGCTIDLAKVGSPHTPIGELQALSGLPAYEFNHSRSYWTESRISKGLRFREQRRHELLGVRESDWNPLQPKWRNLIRLSEHKWIPDHRFGEQQLYPAAGMIVMVIEACRQLVGPGLCPAGYQFHDITFPTGFAVPLDADTVEAQLHLDPYKSTQGSQVTRWDFQIFAWANNAWTAVCRGTIALDWAPKRSRSFDAERLKSLDLEELSHSQTGQHWAKVPSDQFYENLSACGQNFGPTFKTLRDLRIGEDGRATALVVLDGWNEKVEGQPKIAHHVIHPTDLDGMLQAGVAAYSHGGHRTIPVLLPTRVQALWISHDLIDRKPHQEMRILARTAFQGYREADFVIGAVDMENKVQLLVEGFRQTVLNGPDSDADQNPVRSCFTVDWRPDIDLLPPSEIEDLCSKAVDPRTMVAGGEVDRQELVSQFYLKRALQTVSSGQIEGFPSHLRKYMSWVHHAFDSEQFERLLEAHPALVADEVSRDEFLSQVAEESAASKIIVTTGRNFGAIIRGELDPLELFMGGEKLLEEFYTGASFETCFTQLTTYIDLMAYKSPALNILEVGAGTGAMTRRILERLTRYTNRTDDRADIPRLQSYTFTDISPGFFIEAKEKLEAYSDRMEYAVFNLEKCPQEQGFKKGQYDVIVASLVLHATSNLAQTLQRIRTLLKPNGKLVVLEPTAPEKARMSFFFGLLPGWWLGEEQERELCPLLDEARWHQILQETGFSGMDVKLPDHNDISMRSFTGFVSTATEFQSELSACEDPPNIIVIASEKSETQNHLAQEVKKILEREARDVSVLSPKQTAAIDLHHRQCISLLETDTSFFESIGDEDWVWFKNVLSNAQGFLWVTRGGTLSESTPSRALVKGLGRAIRSENVDAHFIELALQSETAEERAISHIVQVYRQSLHLHEGQRESEFIEHDGHLCIGRVAEATSLNWKLHQAMGHRHPKLQAYGSRQNRALKLTIGTPGLLETLCFDDELNEAPLGPEDVEIDVKAVGGSLQDALVVTGQASSSVLGQECSGVVTRSGPQSGYQAGDRVAACTRSGAYKSLVRTDASAVMRVPEGMTLITAATIPSAFATAYYSLVMLANIQQGESVLIHSGASDVGQAAIQVAQKHGARVFTTVGVAECRRFLTDTYQIPEENILSIQDPDLVIKILAMTGTGVDVVFGSHGSESRQASWACVAPLGRFLELAANQMNPSTEGVPTGPLAKGISLHSACLDVIMGGSKPIMRRIMDGVAQLFTGDNATLAPKPVQVYSLAQTESAFRFILDDKSYGKVVVEMRPEDEAPVLPSLLPSYYFEDQATYVIVGGLGGLGSVAVAIEKCASTMPPIKGCIQGAMVLRDALLESTSTGDLHAVLRPKTVGTLNLVRHLPHDLDFLVLLSSVSGMTGSRGQANYAMANTFQDGLARRLAAEGRACLSLNLGSILSVGFAAEHDLTASLRRDGFVGLPVATFLGLLDWACDPTNRTARDPMTAQLVSGLAGAQCLDPDHFRGVYWASKPMFRPLLQLSTAAVRNDPTDAKVPTKNNFTAQTANAEDASALFEVALAALTDRLARLLAVPVEDIDHKRPVTAFGIDSLIGLELRQWAKKELKADITVLDIMQTKSVEALVEIIVAKCSRQASA